MNRQNYYETLGIDRGADASEIKKAYRTLSLKYHPDRAASTGEDNYEEKMRSINEAYEVLKDDEKRRMYDMELNGGMPGMPGGFPFGFPPGPGPNLFSMFFGGEAGFGVPGFGFGGDNNINIEIIHGPGGATFIRRQNSKPSTIEKAIEITLEQAYTGCLINVELEHETRPIQLVAGIQHGETILLEGAGHKGPHGINGDVKIIVHIQKHPLFIRNGMDLCFKKTVTLKEALCGSHFTFDHINGKNMSLNISNVVLFPGARKVFQGLGMVSENQGVGNLIIDFDISFPSSLTQEQRDALANVL